MAGDRPDLRCEVAADPKPPRRVRLNSRQYAEWAGRVKARAAGRCECGCGRPAQTIHHLIGGPGREDVDANAVVLYGDGTRGCHGALTSGNRVFDGSDVILPMQVASGIRRRLETTRRDALAYILERRGRDWLDRRYPL